MKRLRSRSAFFLLLLAAFLAGCASVPIHKEETGPKMYYDKAMEELKGGWIFGPDYAQVRQTLNIIIDNYPYSTYAPLAQLRIADTYYKEGRYLESAEAYDHFVKLYPNDTHLPYAVYREGRSFLENQKSWLTKSLPYDTDLTGILNAFNEFRYVAENYPSSPYAGKAHTYAIQCERALADHNIYVADFYIAHDHYEAAIDRLMTVYKQYPHSGVADRALYKLALVYRKINSPDAYRQTVDLLRQSYPDSSYIKKLAPGKQ